MDYFRGPSQHHRGIWHLEASSWIFCLSWPYHEIWPLVALLYILALLLTQFRIWASRSHYRFWPLKASSRISFRWDLVMDFGPLRPHHGFQSLTVSSRIQPLATSSHTSVSQGLIIKHDTLRSHHTNFGLAKSHNLGRSELQRWEIPWEKEFPMLNYEDEIYPMIELFISLATFRKTSSESRRIQSQ